jgi:2-methylcitrate dehydratase
MADYIFSLRYDSIPAAVVTAARRHLADTMACALAAFNTPAVRAVRNYALAKGGQPEATILGTNHKVPVGLAALVNGTSIRCLDANDVFILSRGGPSGHCSDGTAALLALAERHGCTGEELLTCFIASYELQGAMARSINFWDRGLHAETNVAWVLPIAAVRLLNGTPAQAVHACGLSVATNTVVNTWLRPTHTVPMIKGVAVGLVLENVLQAAELAILDVTATEDALETVFSKLGAHGGSDVDATQFDQLGNRWSTPQNMIKAYPAQLYTQAAIEATLRLYHRGVRADRVRKLIVYGHRNVCAGVQGSAQAFSPASQETADHSTPYVIAMALLRGRLTPREYEGAPWESAEVKAMMTKIELVHDPERDRALDTQGILGVRLQAELIDGRSLEFAVHQPKGHPEEPLSDNELLEKLTWLLEDVAPAHTPTRLFENCSRLSSAADVSELVETCQLGER